MTTQLIPVFAGELSGVSVQLVDARLLHGFLEVGKRFASWITERIEEYSFQENSDYIAISQKREIGTGRGKIDYHLTLDMAKELAMVERNEKGRQARRYFIDMERRALERKPYAFKELPEPKTRKALPGGLTLDQQDAIKALVKERVDELPQQLRAKAAISCWSAIKSKYGVTYKEVPPENFTGICSLIARLPLEGELLVSSRSRRSSREIRPFGQHADDIATNRGEKALLPLEQAEAIICRLDRISRIFHPFSDQFIDLNGIRRLLRGRNPLTGLPNNRYRAVILPLGDSK
jgi:phage anti-repressor protein